MRRLLTLIMRVPVLLLALSWGMTLGAAGPASAQETAAPAGTAPVPNATAPDEAPATAGDPAQPGDGQTPPPARSILRFLTDSDYPPFNYYDEEGTLTGFNVDFARAVCFELDLGCDIQTGDWKNLLPALQRNEADAVIASVSITPASLAQADFTTGYYVMAGRFVARKDQAKVDVTPLGIESRKVGVLKGSAHEAYLQAFFRDILLTTYDNEDAARAALSKREVDYLFGDGIGLMFWINGASAAACCEFRGGPFYDPRYFGDGVGIALRKGDAELRTLLDKGIAKVRASGRYEELLQRYFPFKLF